MGFSYAGAALGMGLAGFAKGQSEMYEKKKELEYKEKQKALIAAQADALNATAVEKQLSLTPGNLPPTPGTSASLDFVNRQVLQDMEDAQKKKVTPPTTPAVTPTGIPAVTPTGTPTVTPTPVDTTVKQGIGKNLDPEQIASASASGIPMNQLEFSPKGNGASDAKQEPSTANQTQKKEKTEFDVIDYRMQAGVDNSRAAQNYVDKNLNSSKAILAKYNNTPPSPSDKPAYLEYRQAFDLYGKAIKVQSDIKEGLYNKDINNQFLAGVRKAVELRDPDQLRRYAAKYNFSNQVKFSTKDGADTIDILGANGKTITSIRANDFDEYLSDPKEFDKIQRKIDEDSTSYIRSVQLKLVESPSDFANANMRLLSVGEYIYYDKTGLIGPPGFPNVILATEVSKEYGGKGETNSKRVQKLIDKGLMKELFKYDNTKVNGQVLGQQGMDSLDAASQAAYLLKNFPNATPKQIEDMVRSRMGDQ